MRTFAVAVLALAFAGATIAGEKGVETPKSGAKTEEVVIETEDGWKLAGLYRPDAGDSASPAAVILVHMLDRQKEDWSILLGERGLEAYAVLAFDMRGHGKSVCAEGETPSWRSFKVEDWEAAENDILAVRDWLVKEKGADPDRVALVGGSTGANLSLRALARDEKLRGAVLLSPGLNYHGVTAEDALVECRPGQRIAIFAASNDNPSGTVYVPELEKIFEAMDAAKRPACTFKRYTGTGGRPHGTDMLTGRKERVGEGFNVKMKVEECPGDIIEALSEMLAPREEKKEEKKGDRP
jgi:dienelactone hydrolase